MSKVSRDHVGFERFLCPTLGGDNGIKMTRELRLREVMAVEHLNGSLILAFTGYYIYNHERDR